MKIRKESGFTLIELLVVVVIIGILAAVALPKLFSAICTSNQGATDGIISGVNSGLTLYFGENRGRMPSTTVTALGTVTPTWFTKYYEVPQDPWGGSQAFYFLGDGQNYTVCFGYNAGRGCDGSAATSAADNTVYFGSRTGSMRTGAMVPTTCA